MREYSEVLMENSYFKIEEFYRRLDRFISTIERNKTRFGLIKIWENRLIDVWPLSVGTPDLGGSGEELGIFINNDSKFADEQSGSDRTFGPEFTATL